MKKKNIQNCAYDIVMVFYPMTSPHHNTIYIATSSINEVSESSQLLVTVTVCFGGARGVMVIIRGNGHCDANSNPGWGWLHFT